MGYMGFGMKKEVYTRKPKDAFEKIKKYGNDRARSQKDKSASIQAYEELMQFHRGKFKKSPWRTLLNLALFVGILAFITIELYYLLSHLAVILIPFLF